LFFHGGIKTAGCKGNDVSLCVAIMPWVRTVPGAAVSLAADSGRKDWSYSQGLFLAL